ncbi:hypothetical protein AAG570_003721 [Ranatra chinensis]|uniref:Lysophospholipid acyltransferase 5 n=1 Tax=Ranatra chinensis TaxID=642074 RepID=A0ABD0Y534_9HEMI
MEWIYAPLRIILNSSCLFLILLFILGYPVALIHRYYVSSNDKKIQHLYFIICGLLFGYYNFGFGIGHQFVNILAIYLLLKLVGGTLYSAVIALVFNMAYLLIGYYATETEEYDIVWTMPHCVLVLRLSGLVFDVYDGSKPEESLSKDAKKVALKKAPTLLETAAYCYFPTSFLVGPQFPFRRYSDFVSGENKDKIQNSSDCVIAASKRAGLGVMYLLIFTVGSMYYNESYILGEEYSNLPFLRRCFSLAVWAHITLYKYVSCWLICEGSCIMSGITYNGIDENDQTRWDGCANINVFLFETALNFNKDYINSFNINTNNWMFQYVYKRLKFLGNKYLSQIGVLLFLALWHGFHSGYYMSFFMEFVCVAMEKDFLSILERNKTFQEALSKPGWSILKKIVLKLYAFVFMAPCVAPLALMSYSKWWQVEKSVYFYAILFWLCWPIYRPLVSFLLPPNKVRKE